MSETKPEFVPLPKAADYMPADKAARLMRHCRDVLALSDGDQRLNHIAGLARTDRDWRRYFDTVLRADPFTDEGDKGANSKTWLIGIGIVLDAIARQDPAHPNHRTALEIWPVVLGPQRH
jgi:hypothetical protein